MTDTPKRRRRQGEGSIYQTEDGRWNAVIDLGYVGGKRKRKKVTAKTHAEVVKKLRATQRTIEQGVVPDAKMTVAQWLEYWFEHVATRKLRDSTLRGYRSKIDTLIVPAVGRVKLERLSPDDVRSLHKAIRAKGLSEASVRQAHAILQSALSQALEDGRILRNVAQIVHAPMPTRNPHEILTADQARQVLASSRNERELCRLVCALVLGMRQGEALGLLWADVHLVGEAGVVLIREAVQQVKGVGLVRGGVKSAASVRDVPLISQAAAAFAAWRQVSGGQGYVFHGHAGPHVPDGPRRDWAAWKSALKHAGVPDVPLHGARGSAATLLMQLGVPDRVIMDILGHTSVMVTRAHYQRPASADHLAALEQLGSKVLPAIEGS